METENSGVNEFLPVKTESFWGKFKAFWLQEVEQDNFWFKPIVVTTTPRQAQILANIKSFWLQEVEQDNFWFKPISFNSKK